MPMSFSLACPLLCETGRLGVLLLSSLPSVFFFYTFGQGTYPRCTQLPFPSVASFALLQLPQGKGNPTRLQSVHLTEGGQLPSAVTQKPTATLFSAQPRPAP